MSREILNRQHEIVSWLAASKLARSFRSSEGFFVGRGAHVRLLDGRVVELLDWLFDEGIKGGIAAAGHSIVYAAPGSRFGEKLSFFKTVVDAPFMPKQADIQGDNEVSHYTPADEGERSFASPDRLLSVM